MPEASEITYEDIRKLADGAITNAAYVESVGIDVGLDVTSIHNAGYGVRRLAEAIKNMTTKMEEHERILGDLVDMRSVVDRNLYGYSVTHRGSDGRDRYVDPKSISMNPEDPSMDEIIEQDPGPEEKPPETQEMRDLDQYVERIDAVIKSAHGSLIYAAPEVQGLHWDKLRSNLVQILSDAMDSP